MEELVDKVEVDDDEPDDLAELSSHIEHVKANVQEAIAKVRKARTAEEVIASVALVLPKQKKKINLSAMHKNVGRLLKLTTFEPEIKHWLDTGSPDLNAVLGSRDKGLPYGKIIELSGRAHGGKTALALIIAGMAQKDGAFFIYGDIEDSRDEAWCTNLGIDYSQVFCVYPKLVTEKKVKEKKAKKGEEVEEEAKPSHLDYRLQSAEEIFAEIEAAMAYASEAGFEKIVVVVDSIANLLTAKVIEAGTAGQNMRTNADKSMFLSLALPRWAGLASNYNAMIILINQIRTKVGVVFGDPTYTPGGNSLEHNCAVRASVRRAKNGKVRQNGKTVGLLGIMTNRKNKAGEGSAQDEECGYKIVWNVSPARVVFMSKEEVAELSKEKEEDE
jgi:RecA/RadA recombinase